MIRKEVKIKKENTSKKDAVYLCDDDGTDDIVGTAEESSDIEFLGVNFPTSDSDSSSFCRGEEQKESENNNNIPVIDCNSSNHHGTKKPKTPLLACSVDFGEYGFAYCIGMPSLKPPLVVGMGVESVGPVLTARDAVIAMSRVFQWFSGAVTYIVEEQPAINRKTCMMEAAFSGMALAMTTTKEKVSVVHVPPSSVSSLFSLPKGNRAAKKQAAVDIAWAFLGNSSKSKGRKLPAGTTLEFSDIDAVKSLFESGRCHDMADALLQFSWFAKSKGDVQRCLTPFGSDSCRPNTPRDKRREAMFVERCTTRAKKLKLRIKPTSTTTTRRRRGDKTVVKKRIIKIDTDTQNVKEIAREDGIPMQDKTPKRKRTKSVNGSRKKNKNPRKFRKLFH